MAATPTKAGAATSPEGHARKYLRVEEASIQKFRSSLIAYSTEDVAMDSLGHQGHGGLGAAAAARTADVEAAPEETFVTRLLKDLKNEKMKKVELMDALAWAKIENMQLMKALRREEVKKNTQRRKLMTTPKWKNMEVEDEHKETSTGDSTDGSTDDWEICYYPDIDDWATSVTSIVLVLVHACFLGYLFTSFVCNLLQVDDEQDASTGDFIDGSNEDMKSPCSNGRPCLHCLQIWENLHRHSSVAKETRGRLSYCQFQNDLRGCGANITFDMSPMDVLDLEEIKSIQSNLSKDEKVLCIRAHLAPIIHMEAARQVKEYGNYLVDSDINVQVGVCHLLESHNLRFPNFSPCRISKGLHIYRSCLLKDEEGKVLSPESKAKIKERFEEEFRRSCNNVKKLPDVLAMSTTY